MNRAARHNERRNDFIKFVCMIPDHFTATYEWQGELMTDLIA